MMLHTTNLLKLAERLARERHAGQVDKAGADYWTHPQRVSQGCTSPEGRIAGWLHDLLEDTDTTADELLALGFPAEIVAAVQLDTRRPGDSYMDYVRRIADACASGDPAVAHAGRIAREVKMSDLRDNMNLSRLRTVTDEDRRRVEKYRMAYATLEQSHGIAL
ncbi:MAG TPA: HD domain-containing protein [Bifidobacterium pullorum]|uniref:HD domain-containing protein n=1 Tax=Bifidobacterium pullorum TaxID=78448 RepID=UPI00068D30A8|nr:HD domain-containing protein [Bifidobacterium pullorum]HJE20752.1 HD domain-containing protein [Bifidobacterium pullorum]